MASTTADAATNIDTNLTATSTTKRPGQIDAKNRNIRHPITARMHGPIVHFFLLSILKSFIQTQEEYPHHRSRARSLHYQRPAALHPKPPWPPPTPTPWAPIATARRTTTRGEVEHRSSPGYLLTTDIEDVDESFAGSSEKFSHDVDLRHLNQSWIASHPFISGNAEPQVTEADRFRSKDRACGKRATTLLALILSQNTSFFSFSGDLYSLVQDLHLPVSYTHLTLPTNREV